MDRQLHEDISLAETMGRTGLERYQGLNISWEHVVETLTGEAAKPAPGPAQIAALEAKAAATPAEEVVARVQAAVAPPPAPALPFASITEVLEAYAFDTMPQEEGEGPAPAHLLCLVASRVLWPTPSSPRNVKRTKAKHSYMDACK